MIFRKQLIGGGKHGSGDECRYRIRSNRNGGKTEEFDDGKKVRIARTHAPSPSLRPHKRGFVREVKRKGYPKGPAELLSPYSLRPKTLNPEGSSGTRLSAKLKGKRLWSGRKSSYCGSKGVQIERFESPLKRGRSVGGGRKKGKPSDLSATKLVPQNSKVRRDRVRRGVDHQLPPQPNYVMGETTHKNRPQPKRPSP